MNLNKSNEANDLLNKIGIWKKTNDSKDDLSLLEAIVEYANFTGVDLDEYTDVLSDSASFKTLLKQDMSARGLLYMDGERVQNEDMSNEW